MYKSNLDQVSKSTCVMPQVNGINCPRNLFNSDDDDDSLDDNDTSDDDNDDIETIDDEDDDDDDEIINHSLPASGFGTINTRGSAHPYIHISCLSTLSSMNQSINQSIIHNNTYVYK
jgi:hypothetical protein